MPRYASGKYHAALAEPRDLRSALVAAARLMHEQGFDPVPLGPGRVELAYEARCSESCSACGVIWIGSKAGELLQIELRPEGLHTHTRQLESSVRTLLHVHGASALGDEGCLLVGTDDGYLHVVELDADCAPRGARRIHLESWWRRAGGRAVGPEVVIERRGDERYTIGVTALSVLRAGRESVEILAATRSGALFLLLASDRGMELRRLNPEGAEGPNLSGWIQWMVRVEGDTHVTAVSRGGELVRVSIAEPEGGLATVGLSLLPTAALPWRRGILLGTTEGLVYWERGRRPGALSVPLTRAAVLCLDHLQIPVDEAGREARGYVIMGLDNGRLRVVNEDVVEDMVERESSPPDARNHAVDLGSAVLAVEVLRSRAPSFARCFLLAALRDGSIRLFHVDRRENVEATAIRSFDAFAARVSPPDPLAAWDALIASAASRGERDAIKYFLLDVVFPRLRAREAVPAAALRARVTALIAGASRPVLRRMSRGLHVFAGDADALLEISMALLEAMPRDDAGSWSRFVAQHLKMLSHAARQIELDGDRERLLAWTRFVRKYALLGNTFGESVCGLRGLVVINARTRKFLDALIYLAQLYHRRYDVEWTATVDGDVHSLHVTSRLVVVAGCDGRLWFFERGGRRLGVHDDGEGGRLLAAAVVGEDHGRAHLAVSRASLSSGAPELRVLTLEIDGGAAAVRVTPSVVDTASAGAGVAVHSLCVLPEARDTIVAGLNKPELLFGLIRKKRGAWRFDVVRSPGPEDGPTSAGAAQGMWMRLPGDVPSRAIAAASLETPTGELEGVFLVVVGSDDGMVRIVRFHVPQRYDRPPRVVAYPLLHAVRAVALSPITDAAGREKGGFTCHVGTSSGEMFACDVMLAEDAPIQPVWRERYERAVLAVQPWRTPLYERAQLLVTVTEQGRLCLYDARIWTSANEPELSDSNNYLFRGARLDRISVPAPLVALTLIDGTRDLVAAAPGGRLFKGAIVYTRDSVDRADDGAVADGLPRHLWRRFAALRRGLRYGKLFFPERSEDEQRRRERALCALVDLEGGALRRYLLRDQLTADEPWGMDGQEIERRAGAYLERLQPAVEEDREQIKIVLKSLAREVLDPPLGVLLDEVRALRSAARLAEAIAPQRGAVRAAVAVLLGQITQAARLPATHGGRLRIIAWKELFSVHVLRHAAAEPDHDAPVSEALERGLRACLRDEHPLVRIEALRAVGVALRNVTVLRDVLRRESPELAAELLQHLFPRRVADLFWLVDVMADNLKQYPHFAPSDVLAVAWYDLSSLLPIFRLFPESTLVLCDRITRAGVSTGALAVVEQRLRGSSIRRTAMLIDKLYVLSGEATTHDVFITEYKKAMLSKWFERNLPEVRLGMESPTPEVAIARRMIDFYDWLACCWEVEDPDQLDRLPPAPLDSAMITQPDPEVGERRLRGPIGTAEVLCEELRGLGFQLRDPSQTDEARRAEVMKLGRRLRSAEFARLTEPVRRVAGSILDHWLGKLTDTPPPEQGASVGPYRLQGWLGEGGYGKVHLAQGPDGARVAVKVFRHRYDADQLKKSVFLRGARQNLALRDTGCDAIVRVLAILDEHRRYPAYVMEHMNQGDLRSYLMSRERSGPDLAKRRLLAPAIAEQIGGALIHAHHLRLVHGDVHPRNILVHRDDHDVRFKLGDFDLAYDCSTTERLLGGLPSSGPSSAQRGVELGRFEDAKALARVLTRLLVGSPFDPGATIEDIGDWCRRLSLIDTRRDDGLAALVTALRGLWGDPEAPPLTTSAAFLGAISSFQPAPPVKRPMKLSPSDLHRIHALLRDAGLLPDMLLGGIDEDLKARLPRDPRPDAWLLSDLSALNEVLTRVPDPLSIFLSNARALMLHEDHAVIDEMLLQRRGGA